MGLFKPKWMSKDDRTAYLAVTRLTDQSEIAHAALESPFWSARQEAAKRLTDQSILEKVAMESTDSNVQQAVIERMTDQSTLVKIAIEREIECVRDAVIKILTDPELLFHVLCDSCSGSIQSTFDPTSKIKEPGKLAHLAIKANNHATRVHALKRITDIQLLVQIASATKDPDIAQRALQKIKNVDIVRSIAETGTTKENRECARKMHETMMAARKKHGNAIQEALGVPGIWELEIREYSYRDPQTYVGGNFGLDTYKSTVSVVTRHCDNCAFDTEHYVLSESHSHKSGEPMLSYIKQTKCACLRCGAYQLPYCCHCESFVAAKYVDHKRVCLICGNDLKDWDNSI